MRTLNITDLQTKIAPLCAELEGKLISFQEPSPNPYAETTDLELLLILSAIITDEDVVEIEYDAVCALREALRRMEQYHPPHVDQDSPPDF